MSTTSAQKDNLARIRDNQRRSRARKREYLQELEQRLRLCELQGIEASAEVQVAARRVAEENRQLRELLHKQGISDDYINHYIQSSMIAPELNPTLGTGLPGPAVQALQQLLVSRRPSSMEHGVSFPLPSQASRETSIASATTSTSSLWEGNGQQQQQQQQQQHEQQYTTASMYSGESTPRVDSFSGQARPTGLMDVPGQGQQQQQQQQHQHQHQHQQAYNPQQMPATMQGAVMGYGNPNVSPYDPTPCQNYGPGGGAGAGGGYC